MARGFKICVRLKFRRAIETSKCASKKIRNDMYKQFYREFKIYAMLCLNFRHTRSVFEFVRVILNMKMLCLNRFGGISKLKLLLFQLIYLNKFGANSKVMLTC